MKVRKVIGSTGAPASWLWGWPAFCPAVASAAPAAGTGSSETYVVLYRQNAVPADAAASVGSAGGTIVAKLPADRGRRGPVG